MQSLFAPAQDVSFFHLNTSNGLSDNLVNTLTRDKNGLLWIGTGEGLNCYDGYSVKKFYKEDYPAIGNNNIGGLICDDRNRIWLRSFGGKLTLIDESRNFIPVIVKDNGKDVLLTHMRETKTRGILFFNGSKLYVLNKKDGHSLEQLPWKEDTALRHAFGQIANDGNDILLMCGNNRLCVFDAVNLKVLHSFLIPDIIGAARLNDDELLITTEQNKQLLRFSLSQKKVVKNYGELKDQYGEPIRSYLRNIRQMNDGRFIITSGYGGVYIFDAAGEKIFRYQHDALDSRSVSANNTFAVLTDSSGYVYVTTRSAGLNYFNINYQLAAYRSSFQESSTGKIFHGFINCITRHPDGNLWLGTQTGLIEWNREKNSTRFHEYGTINGVPLNGTEEVRALCFDKDNRLWVGLNRYGISVLDKNRKVLKYINANITGPANYLPGNWINKIVLSPDNKIWVATAGGLSIIDPATLRINSFAENDALKPLGRIYCYNIWFRNTDEVWIGTNKGAYRYLISKNELSFLNTENGLAGNIVVCFTDDDKGNVYAGTSTGLSVLKNNKVIKTFRRNNGLRSDRCQAIMKDAQGNIWIANESVLLCYKPADSSFKVYDESYGLSTSGFRLFSYYQSTNGEQFWGSDIGLSYFFPEKLTQLEFPLQVSISSFAAGGESYLFSSATKNSVPYRKNNLLFSFSAIDLFGSKNIQFEYRLSGADELWKKTVAPQQVTYNQLQPGNYTFEVRVSRDGMKWINAPNPVSIHIITPWWKSWWFKSACVLALVFTIAGLLRSRNKKISRQREQLETEQAINYFASSIYEQKTADDILWDVTKNCISRLNFEDCVIYLKDEERKVLAQKAAWGPKTSEQNLPAGQAGKILNPIDIPIGKGIVGHVASTGIAEIVNDTSKDERYIVDDQRRFSEIAVPIIYNGQVIGVIDSEHPKKNFFTPRHLSILTTIASLCANKIIRSRAEEARQKAQMELLEHQRKMAEVQLKSLRLQMSPHFLFNALNSIQQIILSGNDAAATKYLSRFSRLLRLVLQHSDREKISLKEEIETLGLYLELESLRFDDSFVYTISVDKAMDVDEIKIATLLVQPFVENAIWHGLLHLTPEQNGQRKLTVQFSEDNNDNLICIVEDNGIGREASLKASNKEVHRKSENF
jgi:ligand-binding sensor domain-containing protein/GAF domain-containing protein